MSADATADTGEESIGNEASVVEALRASGVNVAGTPRPGSPSNTSIDVPRVDASRLGALAASLGVSTDERAPAGGLGDTATKDATLAERFRIWQERQAAISSEQAQIRKAQDTIAAISTDQVARERERQDRRATEHQLKAEALKDPQVRESDARKRALKSMLKYLAKGHDVPETIQHGYSRYKKSGGTSSYTKFSKSLRSN